MLRTSLEVKSPKNYKSKPFEEMDAKPQNTRMGVVKSDTTNDCKWKKPSTELAKDYCM